MKMFELSKGRSAMFAMALGAIVASQPVLAGNSQDRYSDYARVTHVEPLYRTVRVSTPRRECWDEPVHHRNSARDDSYTPLIVGGIAGGVVGNQFGKGSGNKLMTAAGAILGGSLGRDYRNNHGQRGRGYTTVETRCDVREEFHEEERADGYRVQYTYNGRSYTTRMDRDPGDRIPVNVKVTPAY